ncbi:MAG TPA: hypothetical protein VK808_05200 [Bacteroidia bacterium]|nr:hypothetical protein [Bacteroidia bacterium]
MMITYWSGENKVIIFAGLNRIMRKFIYPLCILFLMAGFADAQNIDPKDNSKKKDQYDESKQKAEQQSQDDMKKQTEDFTRKKKYRKIVKKGKPGSTGKAKPESLILYTDKDKSIA